jgi:hypothetical protein
MHPQIINSLSSNPKYERENASDCVSLKGNYTSVDIPTNHLVMFTATT